MMQLTVQVFYNDNPDAMLRGYDPDRDSLRPVHGDLLEIVFIPVGTLDNIIASYRQQIFTCLNGMRDVYTLTDPIHRRATMRYNRGDIRTMSIGDVIRIGAYAWSAAPVGWQEVTIPGVTDV